MSKFTFNCPHCSRQLLAKNEMHEMKLKCPLCTRTILAPSPLLGSVPVGAQNEFMICPHGDGEMRLWEGKMRCWKCGCVVKHADVKIKCNKCGHEHEIISSALHDLIIRCFPGRKGDFIYEGDLKRFKCSICGVKAAGFVENTIIIGVKDPGFVNYNFIQPEPPACKPISKPQNFILIKTEPEIVSYKMTTPPPTRINAKKWESCHRCGGDGGRHGVGCYHCGGTGFEPVEE